MVFGWALMLLGGLSGAAIGLRFHEAGWAGGYGAFRRRMLRLGHIAFFGLGILNLLFALTLAQFPLELGLARTSGTGFVVAGVGMSLCCFLAAWREAFRHLFFIPVLGVLTGIVGLLWGWAQS